jgi:aspartyl protease family protein
MTSYLLFTCHAAPPYSLFLTASVPLTFPMASLLLPLLPLLLLLPHATTSTPSHQMLMPTPLPDYPTPAPLAETLTQTDWPNTDDTSSLHLPISHHDSLHLSSNLTAYSLLLLRLDRDSARVDSLHSLLALPPHSNRSFISPVVSGLSYGSGEYFTKIGIGTPQTQSLFVLDTGSDIIWLQCAPCRHCYNQTGRIFNPQRSRSYRSVPCTVPLCHRLDLPGCDKRRQKCLYEVSYGDGSVTTGDLSTETLTFSGGARVGRVVVGCGHDNEGLFVAAAGLVGLGRGPLSFPSQLAHRYGRQFSYCLVDRTSVGALPRTSSIVFGSGSIRNGIAFTRMVRNPKLSTFYYVELIGISIGGARVAGLALSDLRLNRQTGRGGVIVDSGTSVTRLSRSVYVAVRDAFRAGTAGLKQTAGGFSLFDTCYDLSGRSAVKVPTLAMHFAGGADVALPPENYLIPVDTKGTFCFAFAGTDSGVSIIGNIQQQGFRVVFDGDRGRIAFIPKDC